MARRRRQRGLAAETWSGEDGYPESNCSGIWQPGAAWHDGRWSLCAAVEDSQDGKDVIHMSRPIQILDLVGSLPFQLTGAKTGDVAKMNTSSEAQALRSSDVRSPTLKTEEPRSPRNCNEQDGQLPVLPSWCLEPPEPDDI